MPLLNAFHSAIEISSHLETSKLTDRRLPVLHQESRTCVACAGPIITAFRPAAFSGGGQIEQAS